MEWIAVLIFMFLVFLFTLVAARRSSERPKLASLVSDIKHQMADREHRKLTEEEKEELRKKLEQYQKEKLKRFRYGAYGDGGCGGCGS